MAEIKAMLPVGSLDELKQYGFPIDEYGSCSAPIQDSGGNFTRLGCQVHAVCKLKNKDQRPANYATRLFKRNGNIKEMERTCWDFVKVSADCDANPGAGEMIEIIENGEYMLMGTLSKVVEGKTSHNAAQIRSQAVPFPEISDNPLLVANAYHSAAMKRAREERKEKAINKRIGMADGDAA